MKCGFAALIGRPNVGKSTLMNHLLKQKISITSRKPQTTRHRIVGINTTGRGQVIYLDTPGMHNSDKRALNRYLNRTADTTLFGVDVVVWLIDGLAWQDYDEVIFVAWGIVGCDPQEMGIGPVPAIRACLQRAKLALSAVERFEINEAFAAQYISCERGLGLDREKVNVNGSGIGLGHPVGCTGLRIVVSLMNEMRRRGTRYGIATLCVGGGRGMATLLELEDWAPAGRRRGAAALWPLAPSRRDPLLPLLIRQERPRWNSSG